MDYSPKGGREADRTEQLNTGTHNKYTVEDFSIIIEKEVGASRVATVGTDHFYPFGCSADIY